MKHIKTFEGLKDFIFTGKWNIKKNSIPIEDRLYNSIGSEITSWVVNHNTSNFNNSELKKINKIKKTKDVTPWIIKMDNSYRNGIPMDLSGSSVVKITKFEDEWFYIDYCEFLPSIGSYISNHYICDTIDGVIQYLENELS